MRANQVAHIKTTKNKPNSWGSGLPMKFDWPKLTPIERTMIMRIDEFPKEPKEHYRYTAPAREKPSSRCLRIVASAGKTTCHFIRTALALREQRTSEIYIPLHTIEQLVEKFDLRPEWIQEICDNPEKNYFEW